jgi:hypothetical protein
MTDSLLAEKLVSCETARLMLIAEKHGEGAWKMIAN